MSFMCQCERTLDMIFFLWRMSLLLLSSFEFQTMTLLYLTFIGYRHWMLSLHGQRLPGQRFPVAKKSSDAAKGWSCKKKQLLTGITSATLCAPPKTNMEPEHHSLQKEVRLPNLPFWRFRISVRFFGGCNTRWWFKILFIFTATWGIYIYIYVYKHSFSMVCLNPPARTRLTASPKPR